MYKSPHLPNIENTHTHTSTHMVRKIIIDAKIQDATVLHGENEKCVACMGLEVQQAVKIFMINNDELTRPATRNKIKVRITKCSSIHLFILSFNKCLVNMYYTSGSVLAVLIYR